MSRIGKAPVEFPKGVEIKVDGVAIVAKGPKGSVRIPLHDGISAKLDGNKVHVERAEDTKILRAMHGTTRALVNNAVEGVTKGFSKKLEIVGVGYKAVLKGKQLSLDVGFANTLTVDHPRRHHPQPARSQPRRSGRHRQAAGRPGRRRHPRLAAPRALQGQGRALHRRGGAAQGRQGDHRHRQEVTIPPPLPRSLHA